MNRSTDISNPQAEDRASLWAAKLEGAELSSADRTELEVWLAEDPSHRRLLSRFCQMSARLDLTVPQLVLAGSRATRLEEAPVRRRLNPWKLATAGLIAAAAAVVVIQWGGLASRPQSLSTPAGQRQAFTLADGTRVELNANTTLFVENGKAERRVRLANGEAFFVVSKDRTRPFIVQTPAGSVHVTGTIFNVLTEAASQLDVTVVEGSVNVSPDNVTGEPYKLEASDSLSTEAGGVILRKLSSAALEDALAWRDGQIICRGMPLSEALSRFSHYNGRLITATPAAGRVPIGGQYSLSDLDGFLATLEQGGFGVHVMRVAGGGVGVRTLSEP